MQRFEQEGKLMKKSIKKSFVISFKCSNPGCNNLDFTANKGWWGGNIGSQYFLDGIRNLVDASHTLEQGNKTKDAWFGLDKETVTSIPGVEDCAEHVDVSNGFKGRPEAFNLTFNSAPLPFSPPLPLAHGCQDSQRNVLYWLQIH
jgi:hypothetical protein